MKDCNNCRFHEQGKHPADVVVEGYRPVALTCQDCLNSNLSLWSPSAVKAAAGTVKPLVMDRAAYERKRDEALSRLAKDASGGAERANKGKPELSLVVRELVEGCARGLTYGRDKYTKLTGKDATHNWKKGFRWQSIMDCLLRHANAYKDGEDIDAESGLCHLDLVACNLMFLMWHRVHRPDLDDRYKLEAKQ